MSRIANMRDERGVHPLAENKVKDFLEPYVQAFIENSPFVVVASSNSEGDCDASPKGGKPGFIKIIDDRTLMMPDIGGNNLFQSFENYESNAKIGLVFMIPGMDTTVLSESMAVLRLWKEMSLLGSLKSRSFIGQMKMPILFKALYYGISGICVSH